MKVLLLIVIFLPGFAFAQVIINEIAWMGVPIDGVEERQWWRYEWLELFNPAEQPVSLQGWRIELYSGETLDFTIGLYGSVPAGGYFLVGASDKISGVSINYASLVGRFKNSGQRIILKDVEGQEVEEVDASGGWFAGDNDLKLAMERRFPSRPANDSVNWGSSQNTGGTPKSQNSLFEKERFATLTQSSISIKKDPVWVYFLQGITNKVFMRAFLVALLCAAAILVLRRYLILGLERGEGSSDARKG